MLVTARMLFSPLVESDTVHTSVIGLCFLFEESAKSKMSIYRVSVIELWKKTEEGEKKKVLREFISEHGEHYTHDEEISLQAFTLYLTHIIQGAGALTPAEFSRPQ